MLFKHVNSSFSF